MRSNLLTLNTVAFELVPPNAELGREQALEEAHKVLRFCKETGIDGLIRHVMMPGMIDEDDDRPVELKPRLDVLDFWKIINPELPGMNGLCTQVTAFMDESALRDRLTELRDAGIEGHRIRRRAAHHERRRGFRRSTHRRAVDVRGDRAQPRCDPDPDPRR